MLQEEDSEGNPNWVPSCVVTVTKHVSLERIGKIQSCSSLSSPAPCPPSAVYGLLLSHSLSYTGQHNYTMLIALLTGSLICWQGKCWCYRLILFYVAGGKYLT